MEVRYRYFRGTMCSWDDLFGDAARFASAVGLSRLINVSHSADGADGTVVVWYWHEDGDIVPEAEP